MNLRRLLSAPRFARRAPEILTLRARTPDWVALTLGYLGVREPSYPFSIRLRPEGRLTIASFHDLVTAWIIFGRQEYPVSRQARTIFDIGANIGVFTLYAAQAAPQAEVIALEPFPSSYARLEALVAENRLGDRVRLRPWALAGEVGTRRMDTDPDLPSQSRGLVAEGAQGVSVEAVDLERLLEVEGVERVDLLKLDIEGGEHEALLSTSDAVLRRIDRIALEYHPTDSKWPLFERLRAAGFRLVDDAPAGPDSGVAQFVGGV